jgi:hypothetical protein
VAPDLASLDDGRMVGDFAWQNAGVLMDFGSINLQVLKPDGFIDVFECHLQVHTQLVGVQRRIGRPVECGLRRRPQILNLGGGYDSRAESASRSLCLAESDTGILPLSPDVLFKKFMVVTALF